MDTTPAITSDGYAGRRVTKPPNWHTLVALDMLFNNLTTGLFLVAAAGDLSAASTFGTAGRLAYPLALALLTADLICLVLDLGHRFRFHHMLRVFKLSSPMSLGTWSLTAYSLPLALIVGIEAIRLLGLADVTSGSLLGMVRSIAVVAGIPFALGSAMYKGVLFSTTSQPGWKDARWLGGYLTNSAITLGGLEMLAVAAVLGQETAASALRPAAAAMLAINLVFLWPVRGAMARAAMGLVGGGRRLMRAIDLGAVAGGIVPAALVLVGGGSVLALLVLTLAVVGQFLVRWSIVMLPHEPAGEAHRHEPADDSLHRQLTNPLRA